MKKDRIILEHSFSSPTREIEMADPITYLNLTNEAAKTRDPLAPLIYSNEKIANTIKGTNPYLYPMIDWMRVLFKDVAINQKANLNISGGGKIARYYIAGSFTQDNGILNVDKRNNFDNNFDLKEYLTYARNIMKFGEPLPSLKGGSDYFGDIMESLAYWTEWPETGGTDQWKYEGGWVKLGLFETVGSISGATRVEDITTADRDYAFSNGLEWEWNMESTSVPVRYLRIVFINNWIGSKAVDLCGFQLWGSAVE